MLKLKHSFSTMLYTSESRVYLEAQGVPGPSQASAASPAVTHR